MKYLLLILMILLPSQVSASEVSKLKLTDSMSASALAVYIRLTHRDVYLTIDSPGGPVTPFFQLGASIQDIKKRGFKVHCLIKKALSMAFYISTLCDTRHLTPKATMMMHNLYYYCPSRCIVTMEDSKKTIKDNVFIHKEINKIFNPPNYKELIKNQTYMNREYLDKIAPGFVDGAVYLSE